MRRLYLAIGTISIALASPVIASPPNQDGANAQSGGRIRLAQAKSDTCASDRETIDSLKKDNDRDTIRLMLKDIQCSAVREEGQRWLDQPAAAQPQPEPRPVPNPVVKQDAPPPPPPPVQQREPQPQQQPVQPAQPAQPQQPVQPAQPAQPPRDPNFAGPTMQQARDFGRIATGRLPLRESFMHNDRAKFYRFEVTAISLISIAVANMSTDMRIVVYDGSGRVIGEQGRKERFNNKEDYFLSVARPAGVYFVAVENVRGDSSPFDLTIDTISPAPPNSHTDLALKLPAGGGRTPNRFSFGDRTQFRYAEFEVQRPGLYKIHQRTVSSDGNTDVDLYLLRVRGPGNMPQISFSNRGGDAAETLVEFLDMGRYMVQLKRYEGFAAEVELVVEPTNEVLNPPITEIRTFDEQGDWKAYEVNNNGRKRCFAYTVAKSFAPEQQWRGVRPVLFVRVDEDQAEIDQSFDLIRFYNTAAKWKGEVTGGSGFDPMIPLDALGPDVEAREPCRDNARQLCYAKGRLKSLTRGHQIVVTGSTLDGRPTNVTYSLMGYQRIVRAINDRCRSRAQWLIER